jgi:FkbM family methyltransferase
MASPFGSKSLADLGFAPVLEAISLTCLDVGARGGFTRDLLPVARGVRAIGFEPDTEECARLNAAGGSGPWRDLRFIPVALGKAQETRRLNIYRKRGCSSLLEADADLAARYGRGDYYHLDATLEVPTTTADAAAEQYGFEDAAYFKLDVQGAELEILNGSRRLLEHALVALRIEVSFIPIYRDQPLFADIDRALRSFHFFPMRFLELHPWRRYSKAKLPQLDDGAFPYSEGQLVHGDLLYLRDPNSLPDDNRPAVQRLIRAGILALAYGMIDHAMVIFDRPSVRNALCDEFAIDPAAVVAIVSRHLARNPASVSLGWLQRRLRRFLRG